MRLRFGSTRGVFREAFEVVNSLVTVDRSVLAGEDGQDAVLCVKVGFAGGFEAF